MKRVTFSSEDSTIDRKTIAKIGNSVYAEKDVDAVFIRVNFKDGSIIGFEKSEITDKIEEHVEEKISEE